MNIQPIKTEQDYDKALAEIEEFWGADEGTENGDKSNRNDVPVICSDIYLCVFQTDAYYTQRIYWRTVDTGWGGVDNL